MVPPILMAGIKSTGYKSKRSDLTLTGATLEMEIPSQCGESTMKDFKPSPMNHGKGSVAGQLVPVEYNRLTVSETLSIDEPDGRYMEMLEYRNSARAYVMALEDKSAMEGYLETMLQGTTLKQKTYGTLASSEMRSETIEHLVSLPWKAVVLRYFEQEMRTTPRIHALMAVPYVRTELHLRFAWCMIGLTRGEYDSEERKKVKRREGIPDDEPEGSDNPGGNGSSVREAERRSLFHSIPDRADFSASIEHLCEDAEGGR